MASIVPLTERCERADMGPDDTLVGELPFTGQLPCRCMVCREALSWGALQMSAEASWGALSPDVSASAFAAGDPIIPCARHASWYQVFAHKRCQHASLQVEAFKIWPI